MQVPAPWSAQDFAELLETKGVFLVPVTSDGTAAGFSLGRVVADEAELLTIAISQTFQRQGLGRACLANFEDAAKDKGAMTLHLEVAETNLAARALYARHGWQQSGLRPAYYRANGTRIDAILMQKQIAPN